ncbi:DUF4214 domain-containing protein [Pseudoduganella sp. LjRoot289]|uniref:DUF4214 domain-containing protein n=1 Tax=Pseudoduganella sp. LjRoot289 TaxID=3342314 RepID=UPI003ED03C0F
MNRFVALLLLCAALSACGGGAQQDSTTQTHPKLLGGPAVTSAAAIATAAAAVKEFSGLREDYTIYNNGYTATVTSKTGVQVNVPADSTLRFSDRSLVLSTSGNAAVVYRLYQSAFNRTPDIGGLTYWTRALENGTPLETIATGFVDSPEYRNLYGADLSHVNTVESMYNNALHRASDADGMAYWLLHLIRGNITVAQMLTSFSESPENQEATKTAMRSGIAIFETGVSYRPVARGGQSREVLAGTLVQLDGSASSGDGDLVHEWTLLLRPAGSLAVLANAHSAQATFTPDVAGQYLVSLVVRVGAARSQEVSLLVTAKVIPDVWRAPSEAVPATGNYVYLQGSGGDYIVGNGSYLYRQSDANLTLSASANYLSLRVAGDQDWSGDFKQSGTGTQLVPGYYGDLTRYPFQGTNMGGLNWSGEGRGCNTLKGWFVVDKVSYNGSTLSAIDLRFEQHCEGGSSALHGQVHWDAADTSGIPGPVLPMPAGLWSPSIVTPTANSVYLESTAGDYIGQSKTYSYLAPAATVNVSGNSFTVNVSGSDSWNANFVGMSSLSALKPGYYGGLQRYPFHNEVKGGMSWSGNGRGCNTLTGWFAIDKITYVSGNVKEFDARFEQHCEGGNSALRGKIHWVY